MKHTQVGSSLLIILFITSAIALVGLNVLRSIIFFQDLSITYQIDQQQLRLADALMEYGIQQIIQKLHKVQDTDPKTNKYRYIKDLLENEGLKNNIAKLESTLFQNEPNIEVETFGLTKLDAGSKKAAQKIINTFGEALYKLNISKDLDAVFAQYDPEAKKLREQEEAAIKKAEAESKKGKRPTRAVSAGKAPGTRGGYDGGYGSYDGGYGGGYGAQGAYPYGGSRSSAQPSTQKPSTSTPSGSKKPSKDGKTTPGKAEDKKDEGKKKDTGTPSKEKEPKSVDEHLEKMEDALKYASDAIKKSKTLTNIANHVMSNEAIDQKAVSKDIPEIVGALSAAAQQVEKIGRKIKPLSNDRKESYKQDIQKIVDKYPNVKQLNKEIKKIEKEWQKAPKDKQDIYGLDPKATTLVPAEKSQTSALGTLGEAAGNILGGTAMAAQEAPAPTPEQRRARAQMVQEAAQAAQARDQHRAQQAAESSQGIMGWLGNMIQGLAQTVGFSSPAETPEMSPEDMAALEQMMQQEQMQEEQERGNNGDASKATPPTKEEKQLQPVSLYAISAMYEQLIKNINDLTAEDKTTKRSIPKPPTPRSAIRR